MKRMGLKIGIVAALLVVIFAMASMSAEAKTYYTVSKGTDCEHTAVRYEHGDISPSMQQYVDRVEYDLKYDSGKCGFGVRFYFTSYGRNAARYVLPGVIESMAYSVMSAPEWYNERSVASVRSEIYQHALWGKMKVDIEYHYSDLKWWEVPYNKL